ncbi:MAG TPA: FHA domain-containing protein [Ktedonobacteraceae bacterium]|nr:FHA domain-containing protein [Ktedonobacteraceae bacterium]
MQASLNGPLGNIPLTDVALTIGRAADNRLALADPQSSSHHAEIRPGAQDYSVVDLNSTNGTFVNEQRLPPMVPRPLISGDVIRIGSTNLTYSGDEENEATMRAGTSEYMNAGYAPTVAGPPTPMSSPSYPPPPTPPSQPGYGDYSQQPPPAYGGYASSPTPSPSAYPEYSSQQPPSGYGQPSSQPGGYPMPTPDYQAQSYPQSQPAYGAPPPPQWNAAPGQIGGVPAAPETPRKKRRTGLIIGLVVLLLLIVGGAVAGFLYVNRSTPEKTLAAYCTALQNNDAQGFFNQLSARAQSQTSVAKISQGMQQLQKPIVGGVKSCTFSNVQESGNTATANVRLVVGDTIVPPINSKANLVNENGTWKIDQDQVAPTPSATPTGL